MTTRPKMAFWKLKFFKNGFKSGHEQREDFAADDRNYPYRVSPQDSGSDGSPKQGSVSSLQDSYVSPTGKKPDVVARQMVPQKLGYSMTMDDARQQEERSKQQVNNNVDGQQVNKIPQPVCPEDRQVSPNWQQQNGHNKLVKTDEKRAKTNGKLAMVEEPPKPSPNGILIKPEKITRRSLSQTSSSYDNGSYEPTEQYSPKWRSENGKGVSIKDEQQIQVRRSIDDNGKRLHVSSVPIPQQTAQCFVVNNPYMTNGTYPCYVMNVQHQPYVPVEIYPMMLVPNPNPPHAISRNNQRMVY